jgi:predicted AAA+ superfamily ATPase
LAQTQFNLDDPYTAERMTTRTATLAEARPPVLLDEWQRAPVVWDLVRRAVDTDGPHGHYLLTGSGIPRDAPIHSGAGRIVRLRLRPLSLAERQLDTPTVSLDRLLHGQAAPVQGSTAMDADAYATEILQSGLPGLRHRSWRVVRRELDSYLENVIHREFPDQGQMVRRPDTLLRWLRAYAAATGSTASYSAILDAATPGEHDKPAKKTTLAYRDTLNSLWLLDEVGPWLPLGNALPALGKTPKHFLADPGLAARLLDLSEADLISSAGSKPIGPQAAQMLGHLFEALVALSLHTYAHAAEARLTHLRDAKGRHEVDFIVSRGRSIIGFEVKLGAVIGSAATEHLAWLERTFSDYQVTKVVVTTGPEAYTRDDGVHVVPAALLGP